MSSTCSFFAKSIARRLWCVVMMILRLLAMSFEINTLYKQAASSKSVPSSISSIPKSKFFLEKSLEKCNILPAKVEMSFLTFCGSSMMASNSLKVPILLSLAFICIGKRCLAKNAALSMDFKSIDFPPAFTPVMIKTCFLNSKLTLFGFFKAG